MRYGGYGVFENLIDPVTLGRLANEASDRFASAQGHLVTEVDREEVRGGQPQRRFFSAEGGAVQDSVYAGREIAEVLHALAGAPFEPTGGRGSFTYYQGPGDHLALHRDVENCDLAIITTLHRSGGGGLSGTLWVYPDRIDEALSSIRRTSGHGATPIDLAIGQSVVMFGGIVPHQVVPLAAGQIRVVSALCFRLALPG